MWSWKYKEKNNELGNWKQIQEISMGCEDPKAERDHPGPKDYSIH
jgi:hypothetical protein